MKSVRGSRSVGVALKLGSTAVMVTVAGLRTMRDGQCVLGG